MENIGISEITEARSVKNVFCGILQNSQESTWAKFSFFNKIARSPNTAWKVSKYGVISGLCFPVFGPKITPYLDTFTQSKCLIKLHTSGRLLLKWIVCFDKSSLWISKVKNSNISYIRTVRSESIGENVAIDLIENQKLT